jgi:uncharacterized protein (DUF1501 family)
MQRRDFLRRHLLAALGGAGLYSQFGHLRLLEAAALDRGAVAKGSDYKALVCVFLDGGNDNLNTVIPCDPVTHAAYAAARPGLALPLGALGPGTRLQPITPASNGRQYALHPDLPELRAMFQDGDCAIVANVGPLLEPTTRAQYQERSVALPPQLFSHSDQQVFWQTSRPDQTRKLGWAGRIADLLQSGNSNQQLSMSLSLSGQNVFQTGLTVQPYSIGEAGPEQRHGYYGAYNAERRAAIDALLGASHPHLLQRAFAGVQRRSIDLYEQVSTALAATPPLSTPAPALPPGYEGGGRVFGRLIQQLRLVGRLIAARDLLGQQRRQVFFVSMGGFDFHDRLLVDQANNLRALSLGLRMFRDILLELGVDSQVTTFTASDFGRTMSSNGDGSDHGWGGEHFVLGGAVNGRDIYGEMPQLLAGGPDDAGWGQIIPKLAVDQYAATLARWFGVSEAQIDLLLPALDATSPRFGAATGGFIGSYRDLGFMQPG